MECVARKKRKHMLIIEVSPRLSGAWRRARVRWHGGRSPRRCTLLKVTRLIVVCACLDSARAAKQRQTRAGSGAPAAFGRWCTRAALLRCARAAVRAGCGGPRCARRARHARRQRRHWRLCAGAQTGVCIGALAAPLAAAHVRSQRHACGDVR